MQLWAQEIPYSSEANESDTVCDVDWSRQCGAVIPCFNESANIGSVVRATREFVERVVVIDDGSTDTTSQAAFEAGAIVLRHEQNSGKGAALRTGLRRLCSDQLSWAITLDGDGQHDPADIPAFWRCAELTAAHLIVGNRMLDPTGMPWIRRLVNRWMSQRLSLLAGRNLPDTQNGYRLIDLSAWQQLNVRTSRFEIESELLLGFATAGYRIEFVPVQVRYANEMSKIRPFRDAWRWFRWWLSARAHVGARTRDGKWKTENETGE